MIAYTDNAYANVQRMTLAQVETLCDSRSEQYGIALHVERHASNDIRISVIQYNNDNSIKSEKYIIRTHSTTNAYWNLLDMLEQYETMRDLIAAGVYVKGV